VKTEAQMKVQSSRGMRSRIQQPCKQLRRSSATSADQKYGRGLLEAGFWVCFERPETSRSGSSNETSFACQIRPKCIGASSAKYPRNAAASSRSMVGGERAA